MIQAFCIFYLTLQLSLNHHFKPNKICKKWRQIPVSQSRNFNTVKEFLPSERLSQVSVLFLTICSGLQAFWSTFLAFSCITADQLCWNKWGYGSITWNMRWTRAWHCKHGAICEMKCHMFTSTASKARRAQTVSLGKVRLRAVSFWKIDWQGTKP